MDGLWALFSAFLFGVSQSVFQQNRYTGLILLCGVFLSSPWVGLAALLGIVSSTSVAWAIGAERGLILAGVYGFNGFFSGLALGSMFSPTPQLWLVVALAGALSAILTYAFLRLLGHLGLPALSAPFVCVLWLILLAVVHIGRLAYAQGPAIGISGQLLPAAAQAWNVQFDKAHYLFSLFLNGTLRGVSQIFYQDDLIAGCIFVLGIAASSARAATLAAAGSLTGAVVGLLIGAPDAAVFHGVYGFNATLSALAVATLMSKPGWLPVATALLCSAAAAIATGAMMPLSRFSGLPALSAPFCVASWMFLLALQRRRARLG